MNTNHRIELSEESPAHSEIGFVLPSTEATVAPLIYELLANLGEDPTREGLRQTPERVARMFSELLAGYQTDLTRLVNGAVFETKHHDMVMVRGVKYYSLCEHHLLPFFGQAHVAYVPDGKIIGLSKIPRIVEMFARRLQLQERLTRQIAETLQDVLHPSGIAVLIEGAHMCAMMRGVRQTEGRMVTSVFLGAFQADERLREDFYNQLQMNHFGPAEADI